MTRPTFSRRAIVAAGLAGAAGLSFAQAGAPVRIGSTLALTGPLSSTAQIHKLVGEIYVEQLNKRGGLLGRQVEWVVKDDQSKPDLARTLYEQLVTADKVDLLIGPYATGAILSAMGVAVSRGKPSRQWSMVCNRKTRSSASVCSRSGNSCASRQVSCIRASCASVQSGYCSDSHVAFKAMVAMADLIMPAFICGSRCQR